MTVGDILNRATLMVNFLVIKTPLAYNADIGRPTLNALRVATSTYHLMMKFSTLRKDIRCVRKDQYETKKCYTTSLQDKNILLESLTIYSLNPKHERINHMI